MSKFRDLTGQRFGRLVVVQRATAEGILPIKWQCLCDCGTYTVVRGKNLTGGTTKSCGCFQAEVRRMPKGLKPIDKMKYNLTGERFGALTVLRRDYDMSKRFKWKVFWECKCDCGNIVCINSQSLRRGFTTSCGCLSGQKKAESYRKTMESKHGIQNNS